MSNLLLSAAFFLALHLLVAGTSLRGVLVRALGEPRYLGLFSLASIVGIVWLATAYSVASAGPQNTLVYNLGPGAVHSAAPIMLVSVLLVVLGLTSPNPTATGQEQKIPKGIEPVGVQRITRHPFLWGSALWACIHLLANGDLASIILFSAFALLTLAGTASIDKKLLSRYGEAYEKYMQVTSSVPFLAIVRGRNRFVVSELGYARMGFALLVFVALLALHPYLFGVSPLPGGAVLVSR